MMWYAVLFDAYGNDDLTEEYEQEPTQAEEQDLAQTVGYHFAGVFQTDTPEQALVMAKLDFDGGGCVA